MANEIFKNLADGIEENNLQYNINYELTNFEDKINRYKTYYGLCPIFLPYVNDVAIWLPHNAKEMPDSLLIDNGRTDGFNKVSSLIPYISTKNYAKIDFQDFRFVPFMPDTFDNYGTGATKDLYENIPEYSFIEFLKFYIPYLGFEDDKQNSYHIYDQMSLYSKYFTDTDEGHIYFDNMRMDSRNQAEVSPSVGSVVQRPHGFGYRTINGEVHLGLSFPSDIKTTSIETSTYALDENYYIDYKYLYGNMYPFYWSEQQWFWSSLHLTKYLGSLQVNGLGAMAAFQYLADTSKKNGIKNNPKPNTPYVFTNNAIGQSMFDAGEYTDEYDIGVRWSVDFDYQTTPGTIIITIQKGRPPSIPWNRLTFTRKSEYYKYATYHPIEKMMRYQSNIIKEVTADNSNYQILLISEDVNTNVVVYHAVGTGAVNLNVKIFNTQTWYHSNVKFAYSGTMPYWNYTLLNKSQIFAASETAISTHELYLTHPTKDSRVELTADEIQAFTDLIKISNNNYGYAITKAEQVNGLINNLALKFTITNTTEVASGETAEITVSVLQATMNNAIINFSDNFKVTHNKGENKIDPIPIPNPPSPPEVTPDPTPINPNPVDPNPTPDPDPTPVIPPNITDNSTLPDGLGVYNVPMVKESSGWPITADIKVNASPLTKKTLDVGRKIWLLYNKTTKKYHIIGYGIIGDRVHAYHNTDRNNFSSSNTAYNISYILGIDDNDIAISFLRYKVNGVTKQLISQRNVSKLFASDQSWRIDCFAPLKNTIIEADYVNVFFGGSPAMCWLTDTINAMSDTLSIEQTNELNVKFNTQLYKQIKANIPSPSDYRDGYDVFRASTYILQQDSECVLDESEYEFFIGEATEYYEINEYNQWTEYNIRRAKILTGGVFAIRASDGGGRNYGILFDSNGNYNNFFTGIKYHSSLKFYDQTSVPLENHHIEKLLINDIPDLNSPQFDQEDNPDEDSQMKLSLFKGQRSVIKPGKPSGNDVFGYISQKEGHPLDLIALEGNRTWHTISFKLKKDQKYFLIGKYITLENNELKIYYPNIGDETFITDDGVSHINIINNQSSFSGFYSHIEFYILGIISGQALPSLSFIPLYKKTFIQKTITSDYDNFINYAYSGGVFSEEGFMNYLKFKNIKDYQDIATNSDLQFKYTIYPAEFTDSFKGFRDTLSIEYFEGYEYLEGYEYQRYQIWNSLHFVHKETGAEVANFYYKSLEDLDATQRLYLMICIKSVVYVLKEFKRYVLQEKIFTNVPGYENEQLQVFFLTGNPINATIISSQ